MSQVKDSSKARISKSKASKSKGSKSTKLIKSKSVSSPTNSKPKLFDYYGKEVNQSHNVIPRLGKYSTDVEEKFVQIFKSRELPNITIRKAELGTGMLSDKKPYIIIEQVIGKGAKAISAINISKYGTQDMYIEQRHFEQNVIVTGTRIAGKTALVYLGIPIAIVGLFTGFILTIVGGIMIYYGLAGKSDSDLVGGQHNDSWLLAKAVDASIDEAIEFVQNKRKK
jgi:hypothetical protein